MANVVNNGSRNSSQFGYAKAINQGTYVTEDKMHKMVTKATRSSNRQTKELAKTLVEARHFKVRAQKHAGGTGGAAGNVDPRPHYTVRADSLTVHVYTKTVKGTEIVTGIGTGQNR